tara:strand:- start:9783 stop:10181 length:399 start_codon:yes stop_codon:yes gene_type:complete
MKKENKRVKASEKFIVALALVSIIGFMGIVSESLFNFDLGLYVEALWMFIIGIGLVVEGDPFTLKLRSLRHEGLNPKNFTKIITSVIGLIAIFAGIFSFPNVRIETQGFIAVKGIIGVIAIAVIVVQTWIAE